MADYTTLTTVKTHLDVAAADTTFDASLTRLIVATSRQIDAYCGRGIAQAAYTDALDGSGTAILFPRESPVVAVTSVTRESETVDLATVAVYPDYLRLNDGSVWTRGARNIVVAYTAGFYDSGSANPPADIEDACVQLVAFKFTRRGREGLDSERVAQHTDALEPAPIPASVTALLAPYRRPRLAA